VNPHTKALLHQRIDEVVTGAGVVARPEIAAIFQRTIDLEPSTPEFGDSSLQSAISNWAIVVEQLARIFHTSVPEVQPACVHWSHQAQLALVTVGLSQLSDETLATAISIVESQAAERTARLDASRQLAERQAADAAARAIEREADDMHMGDILALIDENHIRITLVGSDLVCSPPPAGRLAVIITRRKLDLIPVIQARTAEVRI
jgi:hypothetical protein